MLIASLSSLIRTATPVRFNEGVVISESSLRNRTAR
jgi:hypothetical protein